VIDILVPYFNTLGFIPVTDDKYKELNIAPDLVVEKDSAIKAVVIRETVDSLPTTLIQRFSQSNRIPNKILELYFSFPSKPTRKILTDCKEFFVGILYLDAQNNIQIYAEPRQIKGKRAIKAIPNTQIFFSSRQVLDERLEGENLVQYLRESLKVPIFAMLVENDAQFSSDIHKLWEVICRCMDNCTYALVILSGEHRAIIDKETKRILEKYGPEEILFYVKNDKQTKEAWSNLLIEATNNGVRYYEYFDKKDFNMKLNLRLLKIIKELHEENSVPFLVGD